MFLQSSSRVAMATAWPQLTRMLATITAAGDTERQIATKLQDSIKGATSIVVQDTSGGCGSFYKIEIVASEFKGQSVIKQHQFVHRVLTDEMKEWHGLNLITKADS